MLESYTDRAGIRSIAMLRPEDVVRGDTRVKTRSQRNQGMAVECPGPTGYFVKRAQSPLALESLAREAAMYEIFELADPALRQHVPGFQSWDWSRGLLTIELLPGARPVNSLLLNQGTFPLAVAKAFGETLGMLHRDSALASAVAERFGAQPTSLPWVLEIHRPSTDLLWASSHGIRRLLEIVQRHAEFAAGLDWLARIWRRQSLIHNDIRWDNLIVQISDDFDQVERFALIDWELAGLGDRRWDSGAVLAAFLGLWVSSIPAASNMAPDQLLALSRYPVETLQPAIRAFWSAYLQAIGDQILSPEVEVETVCTFAGARLIQLAVERAQFSPVPPADAVVLLQLALNVLSRPLDAARSLFDIPLSP